jgi:release factor glutamine methyltransferase
MLGDAGLKDESASVAKLLLCVAAGFDSARFYLCLNESPSSVLMERYTSFIKRRVENEPVQYIIGEWELMGLPFFVTRDTLIPRQDTETLIEAVICFLCSLPFERPLVLDLCTGSGCVAVCVAKLFPRALVFATDISDAAIGVAHRNAERNNVSDKVKFFRGDLYDALDCEGEFGMDGENSQFDVICVNPPYIPSEDIRNLPSEIQLFEPISALDGGSDGLIFFKRIVDGALGEMTGVTSSVKNQPKRLKRGGLLAMEVGTNRQASQVAEILNNRVFSDIRILPDLTGALRVVTAIGNTH